MAVCLHSTFSGHQRGWNESIAAICTLLALWQIGPFIKQGPHLSSKGQVLKLACWLQIRAMVLALSHHSLGTWRGRFRPFWVSPVFLFWPFDLSVTRMCCLLYLNWCKDGCVSLWHFDMLFHDPDSFHSAYYLSSKLKFRFPSVLRPLHKSSFTHSLSARMTVMRNKVNGCCTVTHPCLVLNMFLLAPIDGKFYPCNSLFLPYSAQVVISKFNKSWLAGLWSLNAFINIDHIASKKPKKELSTVEDSTQLNIPAESDSWSVNDCDQGYSSSSKMHHCQRQ